MPFTFTVVGFYVVNINVRITGYSTGISSSGDDAGSSVVASLLVLQVSSPPFFCII